MAEKRERESFVIWSSAVWECSSRHLINSQLQFDVAGWEMEQMWITFEVSGRWFLPLGTRQMGLQRRWVCLGGSFYTLVAGETREGPTKEPLKVSACDGLWPLCARSYLFRLPLSARKIKLSFLSLCIQFVTAGYLINQFIWGSWSQGWTGTSDAWKDMMHGCFYVVVFFLYIFRSGGIFRLFSLRSIVAQPTWWWLSGSPCPSGETCSQVLMNAHFLSKLTGDSKKLLELNSVSEDGIRFMWILTVVDGESEGNI